MSTQRTGTSSSLNTMSVIPPKMAAPIVDSLLRKDRATDWKRAPMVTGISLALHLLVLGMFTFVVFKNPKLVEEIFTTVTDSEPPAEPIVDQSLFAPQEPQETQPEQQLASQEIASSFNFDTKGPIDLNVSDGPVQLATDPNSSGPSFNLPTGSETSGRMSANKTQMVAKFGGNSASEASVAYGMKWLENHQFPNGSWSFAHSKHSECKGKCSQDGSFVDCPNGATGLALLAFLGGGHTHQKGDYQKNVKRGIDFLLKAAKDTPEGLDLRGTVTANEGMYVHGLCTIALCECSAMTKDRRVRTAAERAIQFIVKAQNPKDGGWRYSPGQEGDTSVVGWQVMALKAGNDAKISFPGQAFKKAEGFLQLAQAEGGAKYKYTPDGAPTETMTAVGLLCRMYGSWDRKTKALGAGVEYLDKVKPSPNNMYYNYYATQVMHHWGGDEWTRWNAIMRDQLVRTQHQLKDGHLAGSWDIADPHGGAGGRHYMTCLAVMTLEVYYRHLPMYDRERIQVER